MNTNSVNTSNNDAKKNEQHLPQSQPKFVSVNPAPRSTTSSAGQAAGTVSGNENHSSSMNKDVAVYNSPSHDDTSDHAESSIEVIPSPNRKNVTKESNGFDNIDNNNASNGTSTKGTASSSNNYKKRKELHSSNDSNKNWEVTEKLKKKKKKKKEKDSHKEHECNNLSTSLQPSQEYEHENEHENQYIHNYQSPSTRNDLELFMAHSSLMEKKRLELLLKSQLLLGLQHQREEQHQLQLGPEYPQQIFHKHINNREKEMVRRWDEVQQLMQLQQLQGNNELATESSTHNIININTESTGNATTFGDGNIDSEYNSSLKDPNNVSSSSTGTSFSYNKGKRSNRERQIEITKMKANELRKQNKVVPMQNQTHCSNTYPAKPSSTATTNVNEKSYIHPFTARKEKSMQHQRMPESKTEKYSLAVPTDIEEIVSRAVSLVATELTSGVWKHNSYEGNGVDHNSGEESILNMKEMNRMNLIAVVIEKFAMDIIVPSLIASGVGEAKCTSDIPDDIMNFRLQRDARVFISVLLNIREVLMLNAAKIFLLEKSDTSNDDSDENEDNTFNRFKAYLLSSSLLLSALQRLEPTSLRATIIEEFQDAVHKYDTAHEEFAKCLERVDSCSLGVTPSGRILPREENIAWRVSYNFSRESHPLAKKEGLDDLLPPSPNACYPMVIEQDVQPLLERNKKSKMEDEVYILEKHRAFMDRCMRAHNIK